MKMDPENRLFLDTVAKKIEELDPTTSPTVDHPSVIYVNINSKYVAVFGTSNENWDGDVYQSSDSRLDEAFDDFGTLHTFVSSASPYPEIIARAVVTAISEARERLGQVEHKALLSQRIDSVLEDAEGAFWAKVAERFPEIHTGDYPPEATVALRTLMRGAIQLWVRTNADARP